MKKIINTFIIIFACILLTSCKNKITEEDFIKTINDLNSYSIEGTMYSLFPTGEKQSKVVVNYTKPSFYYVEITNPDTNKTQMMIKNNDGVHIIIPSIKKTFRVESTWPLNSTYPYILESLSKELINNENLTQTKENDKTILQVPIQMFDDEYTENLKIILNKDGNLEEVLIYDKDQSVITRFVVTKFEKNISINNDIYKVQETMNYIETSIIPNEFDRSISYPTYFIEGTYKISEVIRNLNDNTYAVINYGGSDYYTIVETYVDEHTVIPTYYEGNLFLYGGTITVVAENYILFYDNGIEYKLASDTVPTYELIKMGESLTVISEK